MANDLGFTDPFLVSRDDTNGIAANGDDVRLALAAMMSPASGNVPLSQTGIIAGSYSSGGADLSLAVTATAPATMGVSLSPGAYVANRGTHGSYVGALTQSKTVPIAAADPSFARWDLLVLRTRDPGLVVDSPVSKSAQAYIIKGTPASTPVKPTATDGDVPLAYVYVGANVSSISAGNVLGPVSPYVTARGGITPLSVTSPQPVSGTYVGQYRDNASNTGGATLDRWDGTGWRTIASADAWTYYGQPVLKAFSGGTVSLGTGGVSVTSGQWIGKTFQFSMLFAWGTAPYTRPTGSLSANLPVGISAQTQVSIQARLTVKDPVGALRSYFGPCDVIGNSVYPLFPTAQTETVGQVSYYTLTTNGSASTGVPYISGGYPDGSFLEIYGTIETSSYAS